MQNDGYAWGYVFLKSDSRVDEGSRMNLVENALDMYYTEDEERNLKSETFEGRMYTRRKHISVGCLSGQLFEAEVETNSGKAKLSFIVREMAGTSKSREAQFFNPN